MKRLFFQLPACGLALAMSCLLCEKSLHAQAAPSGGSYIVIPWISGSDAGYTSLVSVTNISGNPYNIAPQTATCNVDAYYQGTHYGPAPLPTESGASFPAGTLPAGTEETLTEAQIGTATGLSLANSGQRATLYITCNIASVSAQMLFVNPGGAISFVPGIPATMAPVAPAMTYPAPNSTLSGPVVDFQWSAEIGGGMEYRLAVSAKAVGGSEIYNGAITTATQATVSGIPTTGGTIYVRLFYLVNRLWVHADYTFIQY